MISLRKACHAPGHILDKTLRLGAEASGELVCATAMGFHEKLRHEHGELVYEAHLLRPNSFCGRSFSVQRDGKVSTKPELRGAAGVQFV